MSKVNRVGLLKQGMFIEFIEPAKFSRTLWIPYKTVIRVGHNENGSVTISHRPEFDDHYYDWVIPKECSVSMRIDKETHFCKNGASELHTDLTMKYLTEYYDKD